MCRLHDVFIFSCSNVLNILVRVELIHLMKKPFSIVLLSLNALLFSSAIWADDAPSFASVKLVTVQQSKQMADETWVKLRGHVVKALGDEKYQFRDKTGVMVVEIDDDLWQDRAVTAATRLTLIGELDVSRKSKKPTKLEVEQIIFD